MAFTKNPLQDGTKTKLKDYSVDLENRIDSGIKSYLSHERIYHSNLTSGSLWVRRYNDDLINIYGKDLKFSSTDNGTIIGVVPVNYTPSSEVPILVYNTTEGAINLGLVVRENGDIVIRTYRGISLPSSGNFMLNHTYRG